MNKQIDVTGILAPLPGDNPAGENLRYTPVYEEIKEARKADDALAMGEWQREIRSADWDRVVSVAVDALTTKTKDLQIAAWFSEALIITEGFPGLAVGLTVLEGLLGNYWETVYPLMEEGDIEFRLAPLEFLNERLAACIRQVPLTAAGYSWLAWQESRDVGCEADTKNKYGDVDEAKRQRRDEMMADGKISVEQFDAAAAKTPQSLRSEVTSQIALCQEVFAALDAQVDQTFGRDAPRISDIGQALEECARLVTRLYGGQKEAAASQRPTAATDSAAVPGGNESAAVPVRSTAAPAAEMPVPPPAPALATLPVAGESGLQEEAIWQEAQRILAGGGMKEALDRLLTASYSMPSERERNRYRLLMAKLCIKAGRYDLARPIVEELHSLIDELHLEKWESPLWVAEVLEALYQCLRSGEPTDEDLGKAQELFRRLCGLDVTKAILYRTSM